MKMNRIAAVLLAGALGVSTLTGCGMNKSAVIASTDGLDVTLGVANFYCRYMQASYEDIYTSYFGSDVWSQDLYGDGSTMEESLKDSVMDELHTMYTLTAHADDYDVALSDDEEAAITEAAEQFMSDNSDEAIKELGATQDIVEEVLRVYTISTKMEDAIEAEADTDVSDEEANVCSYTEVVIDIDSYTDDDGETVDYTDDEIEDLRATAQAIVDAVNDGETLEDAAEEYGYEADTDTFETYVEPEDEEDEDEEDSDDEDTDDEDEDDDEDEEEEVDYVEEALRTLSDGEMTDVIEQDDSLYIIRMDAATDEDETESNRESIIEERKSDYFDEVLEEWQEDDGWKIKNRLYKKIKFKNSLTQTNPDATEDTEDAEEVEETDTDEDTTVEEDTEGAVETTDGTEEEAIEVEDTE